MLFSVAHTIEIQFFDIHEIYVKNDFIADNNHIGICVIIRFDVVVTMGRQKIDILNCITVAGENTNAKNCQGF